MLSPNVVSTMIHDLAQFQHNFVILGINFSIFSIHNSVFMYVCMYVCMYKMWGSQCFRGKNPL